MAPRLHWNHCIILITHILTPIMLPHWTQTMAHLWQNPLILSMEHPHHMDMHRICCMEPRHLRHPTANMDLHPNQFIIIMSIIMILITWYIMELQHHCQ